MKKIECLAVLSRQYNHLMYFTMDRDILHKTEWLTHNAITSKVILKKDKEGRVTFYDPTGKSISFLVYDPYTGINPIWYQTESLHCESGHFLNLRLPAFYNDIYHHRDIESDYDLNKESLEWDIIQFLPHGSGINYGYDIEWLKNGKVRFYNSYDGMNQSGFYCHIMDFSFTCHFNHMGQLKLESVKNCNDSREYPCCCYDIKSYLYQTLDYALESVTIQEILKND